MGVMGCGTSDPVWIFGTTIAPGEAVATPDCQGKMDRTHNGRKRRNFMDGARK